MEILIYTGSDFSVFQEEDKNFLRDPWIFINSFIKMFLPGY